MLRRFLWRMSKRVLLIGGVTLAGRWALSAVAKALSPAHPDVALHAGLELTSKKRRVLAIAPHPGDVELMIGGTLKLLADGGSRVAIATLSRGEAAGRRANMGEVREREQAAGAAALGSAIYQLNLPDGEMRPKMVADAIEELIAKERPDCILAFDPRGLGPNPHPDHAAAGAAMLDMSRKGLLEGIRVYFYGGKRPNVLVDVTEVLQEKVSAVQCHRSQIAGPDGVVPGIVQTLGRLAGKETPAMYTEALCRIV